MIRRKTWLQRNADIISVLGAFALYGAGGCLRGQQLDTKTAVETSLNFVADVVAPTIVLVRTACDAREGQENQAVREGEQTSLQAHTRTLAIRAQCDEVFSALERVRRIHGAAATAYEAGMLDEAHYKITEARAAYRDASSQVKELLQ